MKHAFLLSEMSIQTSSISTTAVAYTNTKCIYTLPQTKDALQSKACLPPRDTKNKKKPRDDLKPPLLRLSLFPRQPLPFMMRVKVEYVHPSTPLAVLYTAEGEVLVGRYSCWCCGHVGREVGGLPMCVCVPLVMSERWSVDGQCDRWSSGCEVCT